MVSSITEYKSYFEAGEDMTDEEYGIYMRAVHNFAYNDIEPDYTKLPPLVKAALRTVIASVRKNKEDREHGAKGGRPSKVSTVMTEEKPRFLENENPGFYNSETNENENGNENEKVNVNTHTESEEEPAENVCVPSYIPDPYDPKQKINKNLAGTLLSMIQKHNSTVTKDRRVPVSNNVFNFCCKEMRELIVTLDRSAIEAKDIITSLENFLKVCQSDTWMKSHTWSTFCKHYTDYTPEFFYLDRYLNAEPQDGDASKKPENAFFFKHKDDPEFHVETFQAHIDDWKAEGRPDGAAYLELQNKWEAENAD
ncbi:MAG: hypothetical protein J6W46_04755 [Spirochaetaceae bacterium]|nr:hypothetical protein [Spirochaetaceae bacterium]